MSMVQSSTSLGWPTLLWKHVWTPRPSFQLFLGRVPDPGNQKNSKMVCPQEINRGVGYTSPALRERNDLPIWHHMTPLETRVSRTLKDSEGSLCHTFSCHQAAYCFSHLTGQELWDMILQAFAQACTMTKFLKNPLYLPVHSSEIFMTDSDWW